MEDPEREGARVEGVIANNANTCSIGPRKKEKEQRRRYI